MHDANKIDLTPDLMTPDLRFQIKFSTPLLNGLRVSGQSITLIEWKIIPSLKCFPDDEAIREFSESVVKIPFNPPLLKGDENGFSPLKKGS